jgi:hypothetical protein
MHHLTLSFFQRPLAAKRWYPIAKIAIEVQLRTGRVLCIETMHLERALKSFAWRMSKINAFKTRD